jgi:anion-transporting  ArsA/GET3 family ATPase
MNHLMTIDSLLKSQRVIICVGSGGVGKTTVSAALAYRAAELGLRVLVMTIDPSRRLRQALGLEGTQIREVEVPGQNFSGRLSASLLNAEEIFRDFVQKSATQKELADRLMKNRLYQQLSTTLSGSQEFTSLLQLSEIVNKNTYDLVILDTPPAQHAVDFLEAPAKINSLFQDSIVKWFIGDEEAIGFVQKIISRGTQTVLKALESMTGSLFMTELNDFFSSVRSVQKKISEKTEAVQELLHSSTTGFVLVTGFDTVKLKEAEALNAYLEERQFHLLAMIINRAFPTGVDIVDSQKFSASVSFEKLIGVYDKWQKYHADRDIYFQSFSDKWRQKLPVVKIPDLNQDVYGLQSLGVIAHEVDRAFHRSSGVHN